MTGVIGVVTDVHLGIESGEYDEELVDILEVIASEFDSRGVDTVVLMGDMVQETTREETRSNFERVYDVFDPFDLFYTPGNHDVIELEPSDFPGGFVGVGSCVVSESEGEAVILVDTASDGPYDNVGYVPESDQEFIEGKLREGKHLTILSHYPLQWTGHRAEVFNAYPERGFPLNKDCIDELAMGDVDGSFVRLVCGHLHPPSTRTVRGEPSGVPLTVVEPVLAFDGEVPSVTPRPNDEIDVGELVLELGVDG